MAFPEAGSAQIDKFLTLMVQKGGSDLHLSCGAAPMIRVSGDLEPVRFRDAPELTQPEMEKLLFEILTPEQKRRVEDDGDLDFAYEIPDVGRFRGNILQQHRGLGGVFRTIPPRVLSADEIRLPDSIRAFTKLHKGLVLVTGPTGSGKSTTLAAMIDLINESRPEHILTIEDPIEFVHQNKRALVNQREVEKHTKSFYRALKAALREDPDVILVGEMRDQETIGLALTAAETGHLVFGTLHTNSAPKTVERIVDIFPAEKQNQVRSMLSESLKGVIAQQLLKKKGGGRVAVHEILVGTPAVAALIREEKTHQIFSAMQTGGGIGMQTMDDTILGFVRQGIVSKEEAYAKANDKPNMKKALEEL